MVSDNAQNVKYLIYFTCKDRLTGDDISVNNGITFFLT